MLQFARSLQAWETPGFKDVLKEEIEELGAAALPLQQALSHSSYAIDGKVHAMIISIAEEPGFIRAKTGIFYAGLIPGCSCADDPTPVSEYSEYCEVQFLISKETAQTTVKLLQ